MNPFAKLLENIDLKDEASVMKILEYVEQFCATNGVSIEDLVTHVKKMLENE